MGKWQNGYQNGMGKTDEGEWEVQASSYGMIKSKG